ncbi:MAG: DUF86 domain-containing protein [Acidaminococcaceae bacterium]|nr:DUF86 domain-containing protein [Acidaminococcaceae bacterium]
MKNKQNDIYYLQKIIEHCENIDGFNKRFGGSLKMLYEDLAYMQSVVLSLQQIGENAKRLSDDLVCKYNGVSWHDVCQTRDKVTHHYDGIDRNIVWEILSEDIPVLKNYCEKILKEI